MRVVVQRVKKASVKESRGEKSSIKRGLLLYLAIAGYDTVEDIEVLVEKLAKLRLFPQKGKKHDFQKSIVDIKGEILVVPNYTLYAHFSNGNRPYFGEAAPPDEAEELYESFLENLQRAVGEKVKVKSATFGEFMEVGAVNDGPANLIMETALLGDNGSTNGNGSTGEYNNDYSDEFEDFLDKMGIDL